MPLKTEEVFKIGSEKHERIHLLSCSKCDAEFLLSDEEAADAANYDTDSWLCEDCA
jgi:hypothetical protein